MVTGSAKTAQQADSPPAREHQSLSSVCPVPPGFFSPIPALILATWGSFQTDIFGRHSFHRPV